jgi:DeoR family transcriptional regulator of aga operon
VSRNERINKILELVSKIGALEVDDAAEALKVSTATIRRDFDELSNRQLVHRTHGGIQAIGAAYDLPLRYKTAKEDRGKRRVAQMAASFVEKGQPMEAPPQPSLQGNWPSAKNFTKPRVKLD